MNETIDISNLSILFRGGNLRDAVAIYFYYLFAFISITFTSDVFRYPFTIRLFPIFCFYLFFSCPRLRNQERASERAKYPRVEPRDLRPRWMRDTHCKLCKQFEFVMMQRVSRSREPR